MHEILAVQPKLQRPEVFRRTKFDIPTMDALCGLKRSLSEYWGRMLTNAEVLKTIIMSHPEVNPKLYLVSS